VKKLKNGGTLKLILGIFFISVMSLTGCYRDIKVSSKYFNTDNCLIVDGKPFFPIGIYSVNPLKRWDPPFAFEEIKAAGFNTVHTYEYDEDYLNKYVKKAELAGLKVLIFPGVLLEKPEFDISKLGNLVKHLTKSPAILSWYLVEEPDSSNITPKQIEELKGVIRDLDPHHPISIIISDPKKYINYSNCTDIFMIERYPVPKQPIVDVAEHVDLARKAVKDRIPVWAVLQAFGYQNEKNKGWGWKREPTYQEMKAMTYLAIVRGARGIFYFTYHGSEYFIKDSPRHWEDLKAIVGELRAIYPLLVAPEVEDGLISISMTGINRSSSFWMIRQVKEGNSLIQAGTYLIVVNGGNQSGTATFVIKRATSNVRVILEDRVIPVTKGIFSDNFKPYEVHIYSLE
jgi:hypothetical protein